MAESFFGCKPLARRRLRSQAEVRMAIFGYIEGLYALLHLNSALDYRSPVAFDQETEEDLFGLT